MAQPDLKTLEGASQFLNYHSPNSGQKICHEEVNRGFQDLLAMLWHSVPDGPGKTIFIRRLNEARMAANSCIANEGA